MGKWTSLVVLVVVMVLSGLAYGQPNDQPNLEPGSIGGPIQAGQGGQSPEATAQPATTVQAPQSASPSPSGPQEVRVVGDLNVRLIGQPAQSGGHHRSSGGHKSSGSRPAAPAPSQPSGTRVDNLNIYVSPQGTVSTPAPAVPPASPGSAVSAPPSGGSPSETPAESGVKEKKMEAVPTNWTVVWGLVALFGAAAAIVIVCTIFVTNRHMKEEETRQKKSDTHKELASLALKNQLASIDVDGEGDNVPMDVTVFESGTVMASTKRRRATAPAPQIHAVVPPVQALVVTGATPANAVQVINLGATYAQPGDIGRRQAEADARREQPAPPVPPAPPERPAAEPPAPEVDPAAAAARGAAG